MRGLLILTIASITLLSCRVKKKTNKLLMLDCKHAKLKELRYLSTFINKENREVYSFMYEKMNITNDSIEWTITHDGELNGLNSIIYRKYIIYGQKLTDILKKNDVCFLSTEDIRSNYGLPSTIGRRQDGTIESLYYRFNSWTHEDCANKNEPRHLQYKNCRLISFRFNKSDELIDIDTELFQP